MNYYIEENHLLDLDRKYEKYQRNAENRLVFNHYTDIDSLEKILKGQTIQMSRIDNVNDLAEMQYIGEEKLYKRVFIACFTHNMFESIPQWYMYTHNSGKDEKGVYISFTLKSRIEHDLTGLVDHNKCAEIYYADNEKDEYEIRNQMGGCVAYNKTNNKNEGCSIRLSISDVIYSDIEVVPKNVYKKMQGQDIPIITTLARYKTRYWDFEHESRIIGTFVSTSKRLYEPPKKIYIPMNYNNMDIEVVLNPWSTDEFKKKVINICDKYIDNCLIIDSTLQGKLNFRSKKSN